MLKALKNTAFRGQALKRAGSQVKLEHMTRVNTLLDEPDYNFQTGYPYNFQPTGKLPSPQKHYSYLHIDKSLDVATPAHLSFLYRLYCHSILHKKPFLLLPFTEKRLSHRFKLFTNHLEELQNDSQFKLRPSEESQEFVYGKPCKLTKLDSAEKIKAEIEGRYRDLGDDKVFFQGGFRVTGVEMDRKNNKTFIEYEQTRKEEWLKFEAKELETLQSPGMDLGAMVHEGTEKMMEAEQQEADKEELRLKKLERELQTSMGKRTRKIANYLVSMMGRTNSVKLPEHILVSQYQITSNFFLEGVYGSGSSAIELKNSRTHTIRVERFLKKNEDKDVDTRKIPQLIDFDMFMRGNPHPNMYIFN